MSNTVSVQVKGFGGLGLVAKASSGHWVVMDTSSDVGGFDGAIHPFELFFVSLAGCTGMDTLAILKKKRNDVERFEMEIYAERVDEHPRVAKYIRMTFKVRGKNVRREDVERAVELSATKYCGVSAMIRPEIKVERVIEVNPE